MYSNAPFTIEETFRLSSLELDQSNFKFGQVFFESEKYITIREAISNDKPQIVLFNFETKQLKSRVVARADSAIMHPISNIIAVRISESLNSTVIQILNLDENLKILELNVNETIVFWRWVNPENLAYVTLTAVYHINITKSNEKEVKIMERSGPFSEGNMIQITGYVQDDEEKWCALYGLSTPDGGKTINGHIQLFSLEKQKQQIVEGHCCCFGNALVHSDDYQSKLFCFMEKRQFDTISKLQIIEIGTPPKGVSHFKKQVIVEPDPNYPSDFPILVHINQRYGLIFIISKNSFLAVYELTTASLIYKQRICNENVFLGTPSQTLGQYHVISREGIVYTISVLDEQLIPFILNTQKHNENLIQFGVKMLQSYQLTESDNDYLDQFNMAIQAGDVLKATKIAIAAPGMILRNSQSIEKIKTMHQQPGQPVPLILYIQTLFENGIQLNYVEAVELCIPIFQQDRKQMVYEWIKQNKFEASEEFGDFLKQYDINLAIPIYSLAKCKQKLAKCYVETGQLELAMQLSDEPNIQGDN